MRFRGVLLVLLAGSLMGSEFQTGQAARAVIGQSSFSAHDYGLSATSLAIAKGRLYAADFSNKVYAYELSKIPDAKEDVADRSGGSCPVCGFAPVAVEDQSVIPGVAAVTVHGRTVIIADGARHRVLIWRDASAPRINSDPDVVLGRLSDTGETGASTLVNPVSVAYDGKRMFVGDAGLHRVLVWNSLPGTDDQPADVVLGQRDFQSAGSGDSTLPDSITAPAALASDGTNLFVAEAAGRRILVFTASDMLLGADAITNSASLAAGAVAPGTLITINASGLAERTQSFESDGKAPLPRKLAGTEVVFDGQALPLSAVAEDQVQAQMPYDLGGRSAGTLFVRTEHSNGSVTISSPAVVKISPNAPGLFALGGQEPRPGILLHTREGGSEGNGAPVTRESPGKAGEVVTIWATGLGAVAVADANGGGVAAGVPFSGGLPNGPDARVLAPVVVQVNGIEVNVVSAVLPKGSIGVYEVKVELPKALAGKLAELTLRQGSAVSNTISFPVLGVRS